MFEGTRATTLIWVVAAVLAVLAALRLFGGGDDAPPPVKINGGASGSSDSASVSPVGTSLPAGGARGGAELYVHVAGEVRRPGLYRLAEGARVATALERAGGPRPRAQIAGVNLAARVVDGQQVVVPRQGAPAPGAAGAPMVPGAGAAEPGAGGVKLSLAVASVEQLDQLDGIGPTLAGRIVEYRDSNGGFGSLEELGEVEGIGEKRLASLKEALDP